MNEYKMVKVAPDLRSDVSYEEIAQLLKEYYRKLDQTIRVGEVDLDKLIELVALAKGNRSQRKFAEDVGVNVSSISRILGGKVTEISNELLAKIAVAAEPDSGVTLEMLMEAQGIIARQDRSMLAHKFEDDCRRIFCDELLKRGHSVSYAKHPKREQDGLIWDFDIITDALPRGEGRWIVEVKTMTQYGRFPVGIGRTRIWLDSAMAYYYRGGVAGRISLIVDEASAFNQIKARLSALTIKDEISVILISTAAGKILEEYVAPLTDGRESKVIFSKPE